MFSVDSGKKLFSYAVAACGVFALATVAAALQTPSYRFLLDYLSDLGVGQGAAWFNAGLAATAALLALFFLKFSEFFGRSLFSRPALAAGVLSAIALGGVAIFPENVEPHHAAFATAFFLLSLLSVALHSILLLKQKMLSRTTAFAALSHLNLTLALLFTQFPAIQLLTVIFFGAWLLFAAKTFSSRAS